MIISASFSNSSSRKYELLLVAVTVIAAAGWVFTKSALAEFSPYIFLALRFSLAAIILACLCWKDLVKLSSDQLIRGLGTGVLLAIALLIWVLGVDRTDNIGEGAFIVSLAVVFVPLIARLFFGVKLTFNVILALLPAVAGLSMLSLNTNASGQLGFSFDSNHVLFLISTLGFALHVILTGKYAQGIPYMVLTTLQLGAIGMVASVAALSFEDWPESLSTISWFWLLCSALIATSLRFALQTKALAYLNPNNAAIIFVLEPVWTAILGATFLAESMSQYQLIGCVLIFCSLIVYRLPLNFLYEKTAK